MRLPFKGLFIFTQQFGVNPDNYKQFLVLYPDGIRRPMKGHNGLDFGTPHRTEIVAPHSGKIIEANYDESGYGWYVKIENDIEGSVIAHMDTIDVKVGYQLVEGDHIGWSDNTGNSTGPHCHWGYYRFPRDRSNGIAGFIDQTPYLEKAGIHLTPGKLPVIDAKVAVANNNGEIDWKGTDPNNKESVQAIIDGWYDLSHGKYKTVEEYNALDQQFKQVKKQLEDTQNSDKTVSNDLKNYNAMRALGYNNVDDINKALAAKDSANFALQSENTRLLKRVDVLAGEIQSSAQEDHTTADLGQAAIDERDQLKQDLAEITKVADAGNPKLNNIVSQILHWKDLGQKFMQKMEAEQQAKEQARQAVNTKPPVQSDNTDTVEESSTNFIMRIFQLIPTKGGEKT